MGRGDASKTKTKRAGSASGDDVAGKGQELLSLLQGVDHSKLIALLQSGALGGEIADDTARARAGQDCPAHALAAPPSGG